MNDKTISFTKDQEHNEELFYLFGTSAGNYIVKSWQFDLDGHWNAKGEPSLTLGQAVTKAYRYFNKTDKELGIKEVSFRPAFSKQGSIIWFYYVELTTLPYQCGGRTVEIVVLSSGELVLPHKF